MTTIVAPNRVTSSSSSSSSTSLLSQQQQQHHHHNNQNNEVDDVKKDEQHQNNQNNEVDDVQKDENDDNNEYNQNNKNNNNNNNNNKNTNNSFFDDWKKGNWCWERDYDKYPVVLFSNNNNNDSNDNNNNNCHNNNVDGTTIKVEEKNDEDNINDDNDNDNGNEYSINDRTRRDDIKNASDPGITGKGDNDDDDTDDDDDIDDDDSFYDDWVEGNWCLLGNYKNNNSNNNQNSNNDNNDETSRGTTCTQNNYNNNNNNNNESSKRKRKRSSDDDDKEDEDIYEEDEEEDKDYDQENKDGNDNDDDNDDGQFLPDDNNDVRNHQEDARSAVKNLTRGPGKHHNQIWMEMFRKLVEYKKLHKNTQVPRHSKEVPKLGWWASYQRKAYKEDKLLPRRLALLNSIGFVWEVHTTVTYQALWMDTFKKLIEYKKQHKNTLVPTRYDKDPKLGHWVLLQRCNYKKEKLLPKRLALLNSIDFVWEGQTAVAYPELWMEMFEKLVEYKKLRKNTLVPYHYMDDPKLGPWVVNQRHKYKIEKLLPKRLALLSSIDFEWDGVRATQQMFWMTMFRKLIAYKNLCKDTMVPSRYKEDPKLGKWVFKQRHAYKKNKLLPQRLDLLNSIDFTWNRREAAR